MSKKCFILIRRTPAELRAALEREGWPEGAPGEAAGAAGGASGGPDDYLIE